MSIGTGAGVHVSQKRAGGGVTTASNFLNVNGTDVRLGGAQNEPTTLGLGAGLGPFSIAGAIGEILYYEDDNLGNINWFFGQGDLAGTLINGFKFDAFSIITGRCASREFFSVQPGGLTNESLIVLGNQDGNGTFIQIEGTDGWTAIHGNLNSQRLAYFGGNNPGVDDTVKIQLGDIAALGNGTNIVLLDAFNSVAIKTAGQESGFFGADGPGNTNPRVQLGDTQGLGNGMQIRIQDISRRIQIGDTDGIAGGTFLDIRDNTNEYIFNNVQPPSVGGEVAVFEGSNSLRNSQLAIASGTYTPVFNSSSNVSSYSIQDAQYLRIGNVVNVSGSVVITPTNAANTFTRLSFSVPISAAFTTPEQLSGTCWGRPTCNRGGVLYANTTDILDLVFESASTTPTQIFYHFTYQIPPP